MGQLDRRALAIGERIGELRDVGIKLGLVAHVQHGAALLRAQQLLRQRIEQRDLGIAIANHDGIAHVFDDQVQTIAVLPHHFFGLAQLVVVGAQLFVGPAQIGHIAQHRDHAGTPPVRTKAGRRHRLEQNFIAFDGVDQRHVARGVVARHRHRRQRRREQQVVQLHRPHPAFAHVFGKP